MNPKQVILRIPLEMTSYLSLHANVTAHSSHRRGPLLLEDCRVSPCDPGVSLAGFARGSSWIYFCATGCPLDVHTNPPSGFVLLHPCCIPLPYDVVSVLGTPIALSDPGKTTNLLPSERLVWNQLERQLGFSTSKRKWCTRQRQVIWNLHRALT